MISREQWGAQHGNGSAIGPVSEIVVHHTVGAPRSSDPIVERLWVRETEADHRSRGWAGIGYSWLIMPSGRVYEGRGWGRSGAHTPARNSSTLGVAFVGDFREQAPTVEALAAFRELVAEGLSAGHIVGDLKLTGHRDYRATECPGARLYAMLPGVLPPPAPKVPPVAIDALPGMGWFPALRGLVLTLFGRR